MITTYMAMTLPFTQLSQLAAETHPTYSVSVRAVKELADRAAAEIAARDEKIVELENQITQLKGERDDI